MEHPDGIAKYTHELDSFNMMRDRFPSTAGGLFDIPMDGAKLQKVTNSHGRVNIA